MFVYILKKKKKPVYVRLRETVVDGMTNKGKYIKTGKTLINLSCFVEHIQNAKKSRYNNIYDFSYKDDLDQDKIHDIAIVLIKNKYDISYVSNFMKNGTFTIIHLGLLSDVDKMTWYNEMANIIKFHGRIEYIEPDLYALVPLEVSYIKDVPKVNRLK